jgi:hypothetical protein
MVNLLYFAADGKELYPFAGSRRKEAAAHGI